MSALRTSTDMEETPTSEQVTSLGRLAGRCYDRRRLVLVLWILALIGITVVAQMVGTHFQNKFTAGNTQSQQAADLLSARFPAKAGDTADVVFHTATPIAANQAGHHQGRRLAHAARPRDERDQPVLPGRRPPDLAARTPTSPTPSSSSTPPRTNCPPRP